MRASVPFLPANSSFVCSVCDVVFIVAEVDHRFRVGQTLHEAVTPALIDFANVTRKLAQCLTALSLRLGAQKICQPLHLHQVDLVVVKRSLRKLTRFCSSAVLVQHHIASISCYSFCNYNAPSYRHVTQRFQYSRDHRHASVSVELHNVFPRKTIIPHSHLISPNCSHISTSLR
jgi:hypothetical protein